MSVLDVARAAVFATGRALGVQANYGPGSDYWYEPVGLGTNAGVRVDADSALRAAVVYGCVKVISEDVSSLPAITYERQPDGGKRRATEHPLYALFHDLPNTHMSSLTFWQTIMIHLLLRGNAYIEIEPGPRGFAEELLVRHPDRVRVEESAGGRLRFWYRERGSGLERPIPEELMWHIPDMGTGDGVLGLSLIAYMRETVGAYLGAEGYRQRVLDNDAVLGVILTHPGKLSKEGIDRLKDSFVGDHGGWRNARKPAVFGEGVVATRLAMTPEDAQWLEGLKLSAIEICQFFRVAPHKVMILDRATYSNIEQQSIEHVTGTIRPWVVRLERAVAKDLFLDPRRYFLEFLLDGLLRGDMLTRYQGYSMGRNWGWLSANDVRMRENMNPIGPDGDEYLRPTNMGLAGDPVVAAVPGRQPGAFSYGYTGNGHHREEVDAI